MSNDLIRHSYTGTYLHGCAHPHSNSNPLIFPVPHSAKRPNMFSSYLKAFFIRNDAMTVAVTKIGILTNLASSINIGIILREFTV